MLSNEMLLYLVGSGEGQLNYLAGDAAVVHFDRPPQGSTVSLRLPDGEQIRQTVDPEEKTLLIGATETPGNYRVRSGGVESGIDRGFSVNLPAEVTNLERLTRDQLQELLGRDIELARQRDQLERVQGLGRVGQELFPYLMPLLAVLLALEQVLANRFYRK